jgi:GT2 family glycosyltransferase
VEHLYISIVSHNNEHDIIENLDLLKINLMDNITVLIRDNLSNQKLHDYCINQHFQYSASVEVLGFGANNNCNFKIASQLGMRKKDWFILMNPDLNITADMIKQLQISLCEYESQIFSINLFLDKKISMMEPSLRQFPTLTSFLNILKRKGFTRAYDKNELSDGSIVDWAAGSFLVFQTELYSKLKGFDEKYFMYFEDVDICYRANKFYGKNVMYLKNIKAVHQGGYKNRNFLSKHFRWYICSLIRFLYKANFKYLK